MGASLTLPVQHGRLALGTWQGIYLNEHRNYGGPRRLVITVQVGRRVVSTECQLHPGCAQGSIPHWPMEAERLSVQVAGRAAQQGQFINATPSFLAILLSICCRARSGRMAANTAAGGDGPCGGAARQTVFASLHSSCF